MNSSLISRKNLRRTIQIELSRRNFWQYCKTVAADFYREDRPHLQQICNTLQALYEGRISKANFKIHDTAVANPLKKLMINIPPQHGKSRTLVNFNTWVFGKNTQEKIITCSYNDVTASDFSRYTRDGIRAIKVDDSDVVYSDIFPKTKIKSNNSSFEKWALEGSHFSYMGAGIGGSITSKGGTILIVDDPVKGAIESLNEKELDRIWIWYTSTFLSRVAADKGEPIEIICMTRWSKNDLCGRILASKDAPNWMVLKMEAYDEKENKMLCESIFSKERYKDVKSKMLHVIFRANYHQQAMELEGVLFKEEDINRFRLSDLKKEDKDGKVEGLEARLGYIDVADEGDDSLAFPVADIYKGKIFIKDVVFTKESTDITEPLCIQKIQQHKLNYVRVEANNQGSIFIKQLRKGVSAEKILKVHNTLNKHTRILLSKSFIKKYVYFLDKSDYTTGDDYDKFINEIMSYMKDGSSKHDDAPDSVAGLVKFAETFLPHLFQ